MEALQDCCSELPEEEWKLLINKYIFNLPYLYIIYALQHPIYFIARIPIFFILKCLMLPCPPGERLVHDYDFRNYPISYSYE